MASRTDGGLCPLAREKEAGAGGRPLCKALNMSITIFGFHSTAAAGGADAARREREGREARAASAAVGVRAITVPLAREVCAAVPPHQIYVGDSEEIADSARHPKVAALHHQSLPLSLGEEEQRQPRGLRRAAGGCVKPGSPGRFPFAEAGGEGGKRKELPARGAKRRVSCRCPGGKETPRGEPRCFRSYRGGQRELSWTTAAGSAQVQYAKHCSNAFTHYGSQQDDEDDEHDVDEGDEVYKDGDDDDEDEDYDDDEDYEDNYSDEDDDDDDDEGNDDHQDDNDDKDDEDKDDADEDDDDDDEGDDVEDGDDDDEDGDDDDEDNDEDDEDEEDDDDDDQDDDDDEDGDKDDDDDGENDKNDETPPRCNLNRRYRIAWQEDRGVPAP
ncbi:unnamed protein product [Lampetra fluviatilis]